MLSSNSFFSFFYSFISPPLSFGFVKSSSSRHTIFFTIAFLFWVVGCENNLSIFINDVCLLYWCTGSIVNRWDLVSIFVELRSLRNRSFSGSCSCSSRCSSRCSSGIFCSNLSTSILILSDFDISFFKSSILSIMFCRGSHCLHTLGKGA